MTNLVTRLQAANLEILERFHGFTDTSAPGSDCSVSEVEYNAMSDMLHLDTFNLQRMRLPVDSLQPETVLVCDLTETELDAYNNTVYGV